MDLLDKHRMTFDNIWNFLIFQELNLNVPLRSEKGRFFIKWQESHSVIYTYSELQKLHHNFSSSSSDKLLNFLKLARPWKVSSGTRIILVDITSLLLACQIFGKLSRRFHFLLLSEETLVIWERIICRHYVFKRNGCSTYCWCRNASLCSHIFRFKRIQL